MTDVDCKVTRNSDSIEIAWSSGSFSSLPNLWLRDNCDCSDCRVLQTSEKKFMLTEVPADIAPTTVGIVDDSLHLVWPDGHQTCYDGEMLRSRGHVRDLEWSTWRAGFIPTRYGYQAFLDDDDVAAQAIGEIVELGVTILTEAPTVPATLEKLAPRLGPIRELLFDRIHDVLVDPAGYNVAHTALPLPPHNDFASYSWPPSVQALHMLANETPGGNSIIVDGWAVLEALRDEHPDYFEALRMTPVPFREFDENTETFAVEPIVRCDMEGRVSGIRFSNQLMQTINPNDPRTPGFYRAYHELCQRIVDPDMRATFRLRGGEILIVAAHRVLHGREAFEANGKRHLQDAYFEFDNVRNHAVVLQRRGMT